MYLGDGCISNMKNGRSQKLRIACDAKYIGIMNLLDNQFKILFPSYKVGYTNCFNEHGVASCIDVHVFYKNFDSHFPQAAPGEKHNREIKLEDWQQKIVDEHYIECWRGLYHSDGSRPQRQGNPFYQFTNKSKGIRDLFLYLSSKLGVKAIECFKYKTDKLLDNPTKNIYIYGRKDIAFLDTLFGPKA